MSVQITLSRTNRIADAGRGLFALVGAAAIVAGVPLGLATWVGSPLPAAMPTVSQVTTALRDTYIPDEFLVKALALVCWLVWIELTASLLVEAVAYARGRKAGSVPLAGGLQRGAARLVATVALLGAVVATRGAGERPGLPVQPYLPSAQPTVSLVIDDRAAGPPAATAEPSAPVAPAAPVYEVQRRDTLWDIAERHLGDPLRWHEIFHINRGCPQADGRCLTDPDLIHAGWRLELPGDAVGLAPPAVDATAPGKPGTPGGSVKDAPHQTADGSLAVEGGMVLIDDGVGPGAAGDDVLLASESAPVTASPPYQDMVLLPESGPGGGGFVTDEPAVLAGPPGGAGDGPGAGATGGHDDELATYPTYPSPPADHHD